MLLVGGEDERMIERKERGMIDDMMKEARYALSPSLTVKSNVIIN